MHFDYSSKKEIISNLADEKINLSALLNMIGKFEIEKEKQVITLTHFMYEVSLQLIQVIKNVYRKADIDLTFVPPKGNVKVRSYKIIIDYKTSNLIVSDFKIKEVNENLVCPVKLNDERAIIAYLQGVFLAKGNVYIPEEDSKSKNYLLEIVLESKSKVKKISNYFKTLGIEVKNSERRDNYVVYVKDSNIISDIFALFGASNSVLELQNIIIQRDIKNNANRIANCNVANISKTIDASTKQIEAIMEIDKKIGLNTLDEKLQELAKVRLENPDASLTELAEMLADNVTKSGINHRMRKLMSLAKKEQ